MNDQNDDLRMTVALVYPWSHARWVRSDFHYKMAETAVDRGAAIPRYRHIPVRAAQNMEVLCQRVRGLSRFYDHIFLCDIGTMADHGNLIGLAMLVDDMTRVQMTVGVSNQVEGAGDRYLAWHSTTILEVVSIEKLAQMYL